MDTREDDLTRARGMLLAAEAARDAHPEDARAAMKAVALECAVEMIEQRRAQERRVRRHEAN